MNAIDVVRVFWEVVRTRDPYSVPGFYNPPWILPFLLPLRFMSPAVASAVVRLLTIATASYVVWRLTRRPVAIVAYSLSMPVLFDVLCGNINALVMLGMFLPAPLALIVLSIKPQVTIGLMAFIVWKNRHRPIRTVGPLLLLFVLSIALYGWWPRHMLANDLGTACWNWSLWPWGIAIGVVLFLASRTRLDALASSPFCSPYVSGAGWCGPVLWLCCRAPWLILVVDMLLFVWLAKLHLAF